MVNTADLTSRFGQAFPQSRPEFIVRAPGRVNLIGEHTDYNDGFVFPIAMSHALHVVAGRGEGGNLTARSTAYDEVVSFSATEPGPPSSKDDPEQPAWGAYVRGVAALLVQEGYTLKPGQLLIHSDVPIGGGVSSSAALEVGTALALLGLSAAKMDPIALALLARQAEHQYAHSPCGIMDQFICVLGKAGHALLLDCRSQSYEQVPLPFDGADLFVLNTQVKHSIGGSEYPVRQQQCRDGLAVIQKEHANVTALRDVTPEMLRGSERTMDETAFRRCRHVVTEIDRTTRAADALRAGDLATFGKLMFESHASLRDDYEVSCQELDALVEIAGEVDGVFGARMTGGGFGGCAIALVRKGKGDNLRAAIARKYDGRFDEPAIVYTTQASDGPSIEEVG